MPKQQLSKSESIAQFEDYFRRASKASSADANDLIRKARRVLQKARAQVPKEYKKRFCRSCNAFWVQGKNVRVRLQKEKVVYYCLECRHYTRHPYVREKKAKSQR